MKIVAPPPPLPRLSLGITGHRANNPAFAANRMAIEAQLAAIFDRIGAITTAEPIELAPTRLHSMLADGVDQLAAAAALARGWELVAPLPFGRALNVAINADPRSAADAAALIAGEAASDPEVEARAREIRALEASAKLVEFTDQDEMIAALLTAMLEAPGDIARAQMFTAHNSEQVALAARVVIEQSDFLVAVWDGAARNLAGGTGHTIQTSLHQGTPVLLIDPARPEGWRILTMPEALEALPRGDANDEALLAPLVRAALVPGDDPRLAEAGAKLDPELWHTHSSAIWTGYRIIEGAFGAHRNPFRSFRQTYEPPDAIAHGTGARLLAAARALPGADLAMAEAIATRILPRFALADGISTWLSDAYRSGMVANFLLSALAIMAGLAYQPLGFEHHKWIFALVEFGLLGAILMNTALAAKRCWHTRWFETRRVAEYLRHAPMLLLLGVARPPARWPQGKGTSWPEYDARHALRALGLPRAKLTRAYLRAGLETLLAPHVASQRDYHRAKARRLSHVHHRLDRLSERLFVAAVVSVAIYLLLAAAAALGAIDPELPHRFSRWFTFFGVAFPTLGASIAGIRFFGDFERFAAISEVTAEKLGAVSERIALLLAGPAEAIDFASVAELAHSIDEVVVDEIESWQAVFGGKHIGLPG
jgi:hypothetical protein